jgi:hypothetical protein
MKHFIACLFGAALTAAAADLAAQIAPASAQQIEVKRTPAPDWSEGGRWLVPYEMPGYAGGYRESAPPPKTARRTTQK